MRKTIVSERDFDFIEGDEIKITCFDGIELTRTIKTVVIDEKGATHILFNRSRRGLFRAKGTKRYNLTKDGYDCGYVTVEKLPKPAPSV